MANNGKIDNKSSPNEIDIALSLLSVLNFCIISLISFRKLLSHHIFKYGLFITLTLFPRILKCIYVFTFDCGPHVSSLFIQLTLYVVV